MKKLVMAVTVAAMMTVGVLSVSAAAVVDEDFVPRMNAETYRNTRTEQVEDALAEGKIDEQESLDLLKHVNTVADTDAFGNRPSNVDKGDGNATCVLGDNELGIFRSESAGMRTGNGNGVGLKAQDGTNAGNGNRGGGQGNAAGNGLQDGSNGAQGSRGQANNNACVIAE